MLHFLLKIQVGATTLRKTTYQSDIVFGGEIYLSDGKWVALSASEGERFSAYNISLHAPPGSVELAAFDRQTGPDPTTILLVEASFAPKPAPGDTQAPDEGTLSWTERWRFEGVLGGGSFNEGYLYSCAVQSKLDWQLRHFVPLRWNSHTQRARTEERDEDGNITKAADEGLDHVATLDREQFRAWRGTETKREPERTTA